MDCTYFGKCGSCTLFNKSYEEQLLFKLNREKQRFSDLTNLEFDVIKSEEKNFRNRAEFRIWKSFDENNNPIISYAMNDFDKNALIINECQIVSNHIKEIMPKLLDEIQNSDVLKTKLFACEFLNSTKEDMLVTLIYHRKLEENWVQEAKELEEKLNIKIIGRSRKQKIVLSEDFIKEELSIDKAPFYFEYKEGGFTQPNTNVNVKMIEWVLSNLETLETDLCELYCGGGNFTIPLSKKFNKVLATEISKTSIKSALKNCELNSINNIDFIRMSSEEFVEALKEKREFRRLKDVDLKSYNFSTVFVDPPRAGLDETTTNLIKDFDKIIYISCNPETLHRDLIELTKTHKIEKFAIFDQFSYTMHIESGVILNKI
ncbi:tRNA (uridine(54)-C5)-methyltransferase TrmA [Arcobacter sp. CECT 8986]|uniref:tRNA (uridine(54)-C5)-methyltransferase TrmA n=1 Tax=Arcobacter sp. CECT 8986 TaxID=2044507 RepID=UPI001009A3F2|nr:tRNA (uridine(54)-C5)-methyltransferase TrmA [Arcobacter sp. CECT 8986]RXJ98233.1 tRNA (uridine(54)-C5)-methyltransferase TrmA [Arcobacter sp. CECT 8986]